jgi:hypothetical protein
MLRSHVDSKWAYFMLGRVSFYLAEQYPFIKNDIYRKTAERRACEIILALKDLIEAVEL